MNDTECTTTRRFAAEAATPAFHAETTVRIIPNARTVIVIPRMVSSDRSLWRSRFLAISLRMNIGRSSGEFALVEVSDEMGLLRGPGVVCHHDDGFLDLLVQAFQEVHDVLGGFLV